MKKYDSYKESGIEWIGATPAHWEVKKLKHLFDIIPSNVDKKSKEDETKVLLCNYVDVYKNDKISFDQNFMVASASASQIDKLTLKQFDVIATKDSEDPNDIGIPALVLDNMNGVVCGYHLTLFRSKESEILGKYLFWFLKSKMCSQYFSTLARGITRYALGTSAFSNLPLFSIGDINEVSAIVNYLDHKTTQIDILISKKQQFISLLQEERIAVINQSVTKGLDPKVKMKDSGIEWLGEIPEHWEVKRMKYLCDVTTGGKDTENREDDGKYPFFVRSQTIERISTYSFDGEAILTAGDGVGVCKVWHYVNEKFDFHQRVYMMSNFQLVLGKYLFYYLKENFGKEVMKLSAKSTVDSLRRPMFQNFMVCFGSLDEQKRIIEQIEIEEIRIDTLIGKSQQEIELLKEYKTALISEVVTGKFDVRDVVLN
jgi:type I restriction enzyme S subunit